MASCLEQLKLVSRESSQQTSSPSEGTYELKLLPEKLVRRVPPCQVHVECQDTRKRHSECSVLEDMECDTDGPLIDRDRAKRLRVDTTAANLPDTNYVSACNVRTDNHCHKEGSLMPVPSHSIGNRSSLSSISEGRETTQNTLVEESSDSKLKSELSDDSSLASHIWVAPELASFCMSQQSLLPSGIVEKM